MIKRIDLKSVMIAPKEEWEENDPVLSIGNLMMEKGTTKSKLSDGVHKWSELHYFTDGEGGDAIAVDADGLLTDVTNIKIQPNDLQNDFDVIDTGEIGQKAEDDMVVHRKGVKTETIEGETIGTIQTTLNGVSDNTLFTTNAATIADLGSDADLSAIVTAFNGLLAVLRTRGIIG